MILERKFNPALPVNAGMLSAIFAIIRVFSNNNRFRFICQEKISRNAHESSSLWCSS
jgi:hypothetical protein